MDGQARSRKRKVGRNDHDGRIAGEDNDTDAIFMKQVKDIRAGFDNIRWDSNKKNQNK